MEYVFRRTPGVIFDLMQLLIMKLNDQGKWSKQITYSEDSLSYISYVLSQYPNPAPELFIFFYRLDDNSESYFESLFRKLLQEHPTDLLKEDFINFLACKDRVHFEVNRFYFGESVDYRDLEQVTEAIKKNKKLDFVMKQRILQFYINPESCINKLIEVFDSYYKRVIEEYEQKANAILKRQENLNVTAVLDSLEIRDQVAELEATSERAKGIVSCTQIVKTALWHNIDRFLFLIVGEIDPYEVEEVTETTADLEKMGNAISEEHRVKVIELIMKYGGMTALEISRKLGLTGKKTQYHLDILRHCGALRTTSKGKTNYYWINVEAWQQVVDILKSWVRGDQLKIR